MRFYLDADISFRVAEAVRRMEPSIDIASAQELRHSGVSDDDELALAVREKRCIVTRNYRDFADLALRSVSTEDDNAGILFVPKSLKNDDFGGIARAIVRSHPHDLPPNSTDYLQPDER